MGVKLHKLLIIFLVLIAAAISPAISKNENDCIPDFDWVYEVNRENDLERMHRDYLGFTLCHRCGARILDHEREASMSTGFPLCFNCMADDYIEKHGITDEQKQKDIHNLFRDCYWSGGK